MWEALFLAPAVLIGLVDWFLTRRSLTADRAVRAAMEAEASEDSNDHAA